MVNICKLKLTNLQQEILRLLFIKTGQKLNQRQISKLLEVSQPAVIKALPELKKKSFINSSQDPETKRWFIELNRENRRMIQLKRADNLRLVYETGLADFLEKEFAGATVILFGSYSKGEDSVNSDIDIAIVGRKSKTVDMEKYGSLLGRKININFYDSFAKVHKNLRENLFNGIVLAGGVEL